MHMVEDRPDRIVGWNPVGTTISYWAGPDGADPRELPLDRRFSIELGTARRTWIGGGVLRVIRSGSRGRSSTSGMPRAAPSPRGASTSSRRSRVTATCWTPWTGTSTSSSIRRSHRGGRTRTKRRRQWHPLSPVGGPACGTGGGRSPRRGPTSVAGRDRRLARVPSGPGLGTARPAGALGRAVTWTCARQRVETDRMAPAAEVADLLDAEPDEHPYWTWTATRRRLVEPADPVALGRPVPRSPLVPLVGAEFEHGGAIVESR